MRSSQSGGDAIDVCALLPREEARKILGYTVSRRPAQRSDGATECRYAGGTAGTVAVMAGTRHTQSQVGHLHERAEGVGRVAGPVAGVGAGAFFWDAHRLYVQAGNSQIAVSTSPSPGDDPAKIRASSIALAKALIAKLKG